MPESGSSMAEKMAYQCTERESAVRMIPSTEHFRMRTKGKVVQGEHRYLETSDLSVGFKKAAGKPFTHQYTTWCLFFLAKCLLELNMYSYGRKVVETW